ncbi:lipid A deacylase LpxR family protein [Adhaeribacter radiodurans]|uniref:Lipid A deacylase LpxR family protein n=1 Tax=Adhaeribacter radiodurans TaxID=2745197 RepID=A0A7L7LD40_9BACT|nr:lipid A deacylase LpxR family protein [Adhaeribacter radiodurans]QMU30758.1 lipid A deacylase LpxR family protein [Adhaeribacter radiodurans]
MKQLLTSVRITFITGNIFLKSLSQILLLFSFLLVTPLTKASTVADSSSINPSKLFYFIFDNDATFKVDYYYTQGIGVVHYNPSFRKSLLNKVLLQPGSAYAEKFYGLAFKHDSFTPTNIRDSNLRIGDRPYASYMFVSQLAGSTHKSSHERFISSLDLGVMGPATGAGKFQRVIHEYLHHGIPQGWKYQIKTDIVLNYNLEYQKGLVHTQPLELIGEGGASLGTLYTNVRAGTYLRFGWMNSNFSDLGISNKTARSQENLRKFQFYAFGRSQGKLVGYNATMQGGIFNSNNIYTLSAKEISRTVLESQAGLVCIIKGLRLESAVNFMSPEFKGSRRHKWMHFNVGFAF